MLQQKPATAPTHDHGTFKKGRFKPNTTGEIVGGMMVSFIIMGSTRIPVGASACPHFVPLFQSDTYFFIL